jgi:hypothetical protein
MRTGRLLARKAGPRLCSQGAICYYMTVLVLIYVIATLYTGAMTCPLTTRPRLAGFRVQTMPSYLLPLRTHKSAFAAMRGVRMLMRVATC